MLVPPSVAGIRRCGSLAQDHVTTPDGVSISGKKTPQLGDKANLKDILPGTYVGVWDRWPGVACDGDNYWCPCWKKGTTDYRYVCCKYQKGTSPGVCNCNANDPCSTPL